MGKTDTGCRRMHVIWFGETGGWLLDAGFWFLVFGCWLFTKTIQMFFISKKVEILFKIATTY
jgi:hypothetical protein